MHQVSKIYVSIDGAKVHLRILGDGPALVMFHPSPHTSKMLLPIARQLASRYMVFCVDTPGYGASESLKAPPLHLSDYTEVFNKVFKALKLQRPSFYGTATGAQIAIRYALDYPEDVGHVYLDNAAHFDDGLRDDILEHYFPDLGPQSDGTHLKTLWRMVENLFAYFPWCFTSAAFKLDKPKPSAEVLHFIATEFLNAGEQYDYAYRAAFLHENAANVRQLTCDTTIFRWKGSILLPYIDALLAFEMPQNIGTASIPEDAAARIKSMTDLMNEKASGFVPCDIDYAAATDADMAVVARPSYRKPSTALPEINKNGSHLWAAWEMIRLENANLSPQEIQACLLDWFANTKIEQV